MAELKRHMATNNSHTVTGSGALTDVKDVVIDSGVYKYVLIMVCVYMSLQGLRLIVIMNTPMADSIQSFEARLLQFDWPNGNLYLCSDQVHDPATGEEKAIVRGTYGAAYHADVADPWVRDLQKKVGFWTKTRVEKSRILIS